MASSRPPLDPQKQWVLVDTDTGLDDAHSLLYLLAQPDVEIVGITTIYGNTPVEDSARNVRTVLRLAEREDIPVHLGEYAPLEGEASIADFVHGVDGLGDRFERAELRVEDETAVDYIVRIANEHPGKVDLHPLGPLTNIAKALERDPELFLKYRSVVIMGGAGPYPAPGGATLTDANTANDRRAAEIVFGAANRGNVVMVGVNVTATAILDEHVYASLRAIDTPWAQFSAGVLDAYNDFYQYKWGRRISSAHDGLSTVILHRPEIVTGWIEGPVDFTPYGGSLATRVALTNDGLPLVWGTPDGAVTRAVTSFDATQFRRRFVHALAYGTSRAPLDPAGRVAPAGWANGRPVGE
jgi:inosine-uridine nucleoside N-ribohydrolase